jgi:hypothetical protein
MALDPPRRGTAATAPRSGCAEPLELRPAEQMRPSEPENRPLRRIRNVFLPNPRIAAGRISKVRPKRARFFLAFGGPFEPDVGRCLSQIPARKRSKRRTWSGRPFENAPPQGVHSKGVLFDTKMVVFWVTGGHHGQYEWNDRGSQYLEFDESTGSAGCARVQG